MGVGIGVREFGEGFLGSGVLSGTRITDSSDQITGSR